MQRKYTVLIERDENGWLVSDVVELPGCHTQAKTVDLLLERTREAILAYKEALKGAVPTAEFVGIQQVTV